MLEYSVLNNLEDENAAQGEDEVLTASDKDHAQIQTGAMKTPKVTTRPPDSPLIKISETQRERQSNGKE